MQEKYDAILHIGAGKTGSSAIQGFIRDNHHWLRRHGIAIPNGKFRFAQNIGGHQVFGCQEFFNADGVGFFHRLNHMMEKRAAQTVLLSAENMSNSGNEKYFRKFCATYKTKVILYIRRQDEYLASAWQQWYGKTNSNLDGWLQDAIFKLAHWDKTIAAWENVAGRGNVVPRVFERKRLPEGNVVYDFLNALELDWNTHKTELKLDMGDVNRSYHNILTSMFAGRSDLFEGVHDDKFYRFITSVCGEKYLGSSSLSLISRDWRERIISHYDSGNNLVREQFFASEPSLFSPIDHGKFEYAEDIDLGLAQRNTLIDIVSALYLTQKNRDG